LPPLPSDWSCSHYATLLRRTPNSLSPLRTARRGAQHHRLSPNSSRRALSHTTRRWQDEPATKLRWQREVLARTTRPPGASFAHPRDTPKITDFGTRLASAPRRSWNAPGIEPARPGRLGRQQSRSVSLVLAGTVVWHAWKCRRQRRMSCQCRAYWDWVKAGRPWRNAVPARSVPAPTSPPSCSDYLPSSGKHLIQRR